LRSPDAWFALGEAVFRHVVRALSRHGVRTHPELRFVQADAPTPYYEPATRTIQFGVADPATPKGRLYWYFFQHLVGAADLTAVQRTIDVTLPWGVAHEVAHHLRHHYHAPIDNDFIEEQVANCIAIALLREHSVYRHGLGALRDWAHHTFAGAHALSPETAAYLAGDRLEIGEVLVAQGVIPRSAWAEVRDLAEATGTAAEEMLVRLRKVSASELERARAERAEAEAYFNRRYMASLGEYWLFGAEWLTAYLEREDRLSLGEAVERYLLTKDWEASRREATRLLLEQSLRGADPYVSAAAADALAELAGSAAIPALVAALADPRPPVRIGALQSLSKLPGGPDAGAPLARALLAEAGGVGGSAARLLRLAGTRLDLLDDRDPVQRAERALVVLASDPAAAYRLLGDLLSGDEPSTLAALEALRQTRPGPLADSVMEKLESSQPSVRAAAARALSTYPEAGTVLVGRLVDDDAAVRFAAREALGHLGVGAWPALAATAASGPDPLSVEALCLADELGAPAVPPLLRVLSAALLGRSERAARLEARLMAHPQLDLLTQVAGEERRRLARLALRAFGQVADPDARDIAERALDSPNPTHQAGGRQLVRHALGRRGQRLARLLEPRVAGAVPGTIGRALAAALSAEQAMVRAVAAHLTPRTLPPDQARALLRRAAADPDQFVREEVDQVLRRSAPACGGQMLTTIEKLMFLRAIPTFWTAELETLRSVAELFMTQRFEAGEVIVTEEEPGDELYVLTEGRVVVSVGGHQINELHARQYFGEMALFDGQPRVATVTAAEDTTVLRLERDAFYQLGRQCPDLLMGVIRVLSERLREMIALQEEPPDVGSSA
jgi:HEAT repeat protein